ncbi:hypothetical protein U8V72_17700 [Priestia filamentosa]|uniref:hypothetical protein n=1 Tax=Priestia filamentosa TaxID=1402861 RepID=UPI0005895CD2
MQLYFNKKQQDAVMSVLYYPSLQVLEDYKGNDGQEIIQQIIDKLKKGAVYLNQKQQEVLKSALNHLGLQAFENYKGEDGEILIQQILEKLNKKKIDKNAEFPSAIFTNEGTNKKEITISPREGNGALIIRVNPKDYPSDYNGYFTYKWDFPTSIALANYLHEYAIFTGNNNYEVCDKAYSEDLQVNTPDGAERTVSLSGSNLSFICYTGNKEEDYWTRLYPSQVKSALEVIVAYIFLHSEFKQFKNHLHPEIQKKYQPWLSNKAK